MPKPTDDPEYLKKLKVFANFNPKEVELLTTVSETASYKKGDEIVREGDPGDCMYVLVKGKVRVFQTTEKKEVQLAELGSGDFFGELALVDPSPRSATVVAEEDCQLLRIAQTTIGVLAGASPRTAIKLLVAVGRSLAERIRAGNRRYSNLILLGHGAVD